MAVDEKYQKTVPTFMARRCNDRVTWLTINFEQMRLEQAEAVEAEEL
jgi:hypothetical protein